MNTPELQDIRLYDGMTARVPVGTVFVKAYFDGWWQVMRCFVPRGGSYQPQADAQRYILELRKLGVSVFLETDKVNPAPRYENGYTTGDIIPPELRDENPSDNEATF